MKSNAVGCLLIVSIAIGARPVLLSSATWVNVTGNLASMASECGNLTMLSAGPGNDTVIAGVALKGLWANSAGTAWAHLGSGAGSDTIGLWPFPLDQSAEVLELTAREVLPQL